MPHKYTSKEAIQRLKDEIQTCESSINRVRTLSSGGSEGFSALKEQVRDFLENARDKKDNALDLMETDARGNIYPVDMQQKIAHMCRGQEKAFQIILDMIERPAESISYYEREIAQINLEIKKMREYEIRDSELQ